METTMPGKKYIMGLFKDEDQVVSTLAALKESAYKFQRVHSPIPSHKILAALNLKKSKVGWFTLAGGILGFISGFALAIYCSTQWNLIVSGKPIISLIPFFIVGFEFTVLFAVFGNVIGLLTQTRLPSLKGMDYYDPRCSGEHFGVLAACEPMQQDGLKDFFLQNGGEVRVFD
jgi:molybdopterin-containing oxidoreductase family membrane subunit